MSTLIYVAISKYDNIWWCVYNESNAMNSIRIYRVQSWTWIQTKDDWLITKFFLFFSSSSFVLFSFLYTKCRRLFFLRTIIIVLCFLLTTKKVIIKIVENQIRVLKQFFFSLVRQLIVHYYEYSKRKQSDRSHAFLSWETNPNSSHIV
jgi:hypothetical protein